MLIIRGVNVFPSEIEHFLIQVEEIAPHYQIRLRRNGTLDVVELNVEVTEEVFGRLNGDLKHESVRKIDKKIQHSMKNNCLVSMKVNVLEPRSIPRSEGKAIRILDEREIRVIS